MPKYYPVYLDLVGKPAVVMCVNREADRKAPQLLDCGATVTVISDDPSPLLQQLEADNRIVLHRRAYQPGDMKDAYLAIIGTNDVDVNHRAADEARQEKALVNTVDDIPYCDFIAPAIVERGDLTIAISTNGKSPAMTRRIREELDAYLTPDYADLLTVLAQVRTSLRNAGVHPRPDAWQAHIDDELRNLIRRGDLKTAQDRLLADLTKAARQSGVA